MSASWAVALTLTLTACAGPSAGGTEAATGPVPPYSRDAFGDGWASIGHGCDTRDLILARDLEPDTRRGCDVTAGTLHDRYTGRVVTGPSRRFQIDHVFPLAVAWREGAWKWTPAQRERFANDPTNLRATLSEVNNRKSDHTLSEWLPPVDPCGYAQEVDRIGDRYNLTDPSRNRDVQKACRR